MRKSYFLILALVIAGLIPSIAFSEEVFDPVRKIYMNDGKVVECQMGWLDGARMICRKFGGNMTLPLQSVDFARTFPKYKKPPEETVLLVHPGPRYQDENIVLSNVRVIRAPENPAKTDLSANRGQNPPQAVSTIVIEITNRGDPCEVKVSLNAMDVLGKVLHQFDVTSESRLDTGESTILKRRLDAAGADLGNLMSTLKITRVERSNILESVLKNGGTDYSADGIKDKIRQEKIRALKEMLLKERP
mgnify:CR=1 FL=1